MIPITSLYRIRHSERAKYLQLKVTAHGVELIVPRRVSFDSTEIDRFLEEKQAWIKEQVDAIQAESPHELVLPERIELSAVDLSYNIDYVQTSRKNLRLQEVRAGELAMVGEIKNYFLCVRALKEWLKIKARFHFSQDLNQFSKEHRLPYRMMSVRYMKTRWGSCSSEKNINLCVHALFLPAYLYRYVLLHELAHTKVMDHSKAFWRELSKYDEKALHHAAELKTAGKYLPLWIHD